MVLAFIVFGLLLICASVFVFLGLKTSNVLFKIGNIIYSSIFIVASVAILLIIRHDHQIQNVYAATTFSNRHAPATNQGDLKDYFTIEEMVKEEITLEAPLIQQLPELPRGCEITSLAMLLSYNDIHVDKMTLAQEIQMNPAVFERKGDKVYFGNPNNGFVGDMYSLHTPGLGVYHKPIAELAKQYAGDMTVYDFTGEDFQLIKEQLSLGRPVWVIINSHYKRLPENEFQTWHTEDGPIEITYREHSVLITGYDDQYIYFNDPLAYRDKANIQEFEEAWIQMGRQAITMYE